MYECSDQMHVHYIERLQQLAGEVNRQSILPMSHEIATSVPRRPAGMDIESSPLSR
jgi:hypothetical protein